MQGGSHLLHTDVDAVGHKLGVATGFDDVDLAGSGPGPVLVVARQEPNGWPEPVTRGHLGADFHSSVLEREGVDGSNAGGHGGIDRIASGASTGTSVESRIGAPIQQLFSAKDPYGTLKENLLVSRRATVKIQRLAGDEAGTVAILSQGRKEVEGAILDVAVDSAVVVDLEFPVATAGHGFLMLPANKLKMKRNSGHWRYFLALPDSVVQSVEILFKDQGS